MLYAKAVLIHTSKAGRFFMLKPIEKAAVMPRLLWLFSGPVFVLRPARSGAFAFNLAYHQHTDHPSDRGCILVWRSIVFDTGFGRHGDIIARARRRCGRIGLI